MLTTSIGDGPQRIVHSGQSNPVRTRDFVDADGNPAGGYAHGVGMCVSFQDGPRGLDENGCLKPANGAFVEDLLVAAASRLEFFQGSQFSCEANADALKHIHQAITALHTRAVGRAVRGVLGSHTP
jgi:hypothetical protein